MQFGEDEALEAFRTIKSASCGDHNQRQYCGVAAFYRNAYPTGPLVILGNSQDGRLIAVEIQRAKAERNAGVPTGRCLFYRVGINLGDVIVEGDDIHGDGVNIADRLQALAQPGGVR